MWAVPDAPRAYEVVVRAGRGARSWLLEVHRDETLGRATRISWDVAGPGQPVLTVQRDDRGLVGVDPPGGQVVALPEPDGGTVEVRVVVDTCSVEVFAGGGSVVLTNQVLPAADARGIALWARGATADLEVTFRDLTSR